LVCLELDPNKNTPGAGNFPALGCFGLKSILMITIPGTTEIQGVMQGGFKSIIPFALIIIGLEVGFKFLEFFVRKFREKAEQARIYHQALKDMKKLRAYAEQHGLKLAGDLSPDFVQTAGKTEKEYTEMIALATKYGVKVSTDKNVLLN
jgi:hypothetical protein